MSSLFTVLNHQRWTSLTVIYEWFFAYQNNINLIKIFWKYFTQIDEEDYLIRGTLLRELLLIRSRVFFVYTKN